MSETGIRNPALAESLAPQPATAKIGSATANRWRKRILPTSLLGRALLIIVTPLILTQLVTAYVFYERHFTQITNRLAQSVAGDVVMIIALVRDEGLAGDQTRDRDLTLQQAGLILGLETTLTPDARLPTEHPGETGLLYRRLEAALEERLPYPFLIDTDQPDDEVLVQVELAEGRLDLLVSRKRLFSSSTLVFLFWMVGSSIVLFAVATVFMRNQVRPIRRLAAAADSFGKGRDVPDFKPEGAAEVRQAATAFIRMRQRIKRQITQRTEMLSGVSHDLRTPLTRMKLEIAMLADKTAAGALERDLDQMQRMIEGYLAFVRGEGEEDFTELRLDELVAGVLKPLARDDRVLHSRLEQGLVLTLRPEALKRALTNLVTNALRHAGQVWVTLERRGPWAEITVDDDGPGIPRPLRDEAMKPFRRLDAGRNLDQGGTGLGLTLARDTVRNLGGDLVLEDAPQGGLRARLWLPL